MRTRPTVAMSAPFDESEDAEPVPHVPLWDKACTHLRAAKSKYVSVELEFRILPCILTAFMFSHAVGEEPRVISNPLSQQRSLHVQ